MVGRPFFVDTTRTVFVALAGMSRYFLQKRCGCLGIGCASSATEGCSCCCGRCGVMTSSTKRRKEDVPVPPAAPPLGDLHEAETTSYRAVSLFASLACLRVSICDVVPRHGRTYSWGSETRHALRLWRVKIVQYTAVSCIPQRRKEGGPTEAPSGTNHL